MGSVALAWVSNVVLRIGSWFGIFEDKFDMQLIGEPHILRFGIRAHTAVVRMVLASANAVGLISLRRAVTKRFGQPAGFMFVLLSITQFHLPFWMGRTLPNMFALLPGEFAIRLLLSRVRAPG